jgi:hypothetical protein
MRLYDQSFQLLPALLACASGSALAGQDAVGGAQQPQRMRIDNRIETEYTVTLEAESKKDYCQANAEFEYWQANTYAHIEGAITNSECAASGGEFVVSVVYLDEAGTRQRKDHTESWSRADAEPFEFEHDYEIGDNVDLIRVSARKVVCICTEPPAEGESGPTKGETDE